MIDLESLKATLEKEAFEQYEDTIDKTVVERPDDNDLFKDNAETQKICKQVIDHDEQIKKVLEAQKNNAYTVKTEPKEYARRRFSKEPVVEAEVKTSTTGWGSGFYSSSSSSSQASSSSPYSYSYGSSFKKEKTREEIEREKQEQLKKEIDEVFKVALEDAFDTSGVDNKNIFELEQTEARKRRIRTEQAKNNGVYTAEQKQLKKKLKKMVYFLRAYSIVKVALKKG